ncbi:helix-turn-helix transcriptional regulator [Streptomyces sp. DSM 41527]|uniref:Helix-turn-helix transcriptional regulator n=1 Tax=Streptomyces mooreae TaxID=3075523 RepID=A0ABU2THK5_9ACTN|nr:helix-turn-helix transcriptional regulator [Streptomyces sp. DSM 41527]MDT0460428.1 helix-turn-helix transcriptional regulator [Streptomyces sp. DSM 41527]
MAGKTGNSEPETTDSLRAFGAVVKAFRKRAKLTQEGLARRVGFSAGTIASIEQGRRLPPPEFIERAERVLDAFGVLRAMATQLARQPGLAAWFRQWARLEEQAISLYTYECRLMPGLLQTEAYARELFEHRIPLLTDEETEAKVTARLDRQKLLRDRPNTAFSFIIDEHVFLRRTGGADVTRELLDHVLETSQRLRNVELQVMPLARGVHAGMDGPLQLLETPSNRWYAYCEGQRSGQLIPDAKTISTLHMRYAKLRSQALTPEDSRSLLTQMRGAL